MHSENTAPVVQAQLSDPTSPRPQIAPSDAHIRIECNGILIAESRSAVRITESGKPPAYFFPPEEIRLEYIMPEIDLTDSAWIGTAHHYALVVDGVRFKHAAWCYPEPLEGFEAIACYVAFDPTLATISPVMETT